MVLDSYRWISQYGRPQWDICYWGSKWNLHTVCWSAVGCEWGTTSVYFGITYVCFIPSRLPVFAVEPQYLLQDFFIFVKSIVWRTHTKSMMGWYFIIEPGMSRNIYQYTIMKLSFGALYHCDTETTARPLNPWNVYKYTSALSLDKCGPSFESVFQYSMVPTSR